MTPPEDPMSSWAIYQALTKQFMQGGSQMHLVTVLHRLLVEVEALREALSSPETPEAVRAAYRQAYERTASLSHNAAGPTGGVEKVLARFFPSETKTDRSGTNKGRFASEMAMMDRLGASEEDKQALREELETVETYS
jgi:hypothetical protein